MRRASIVAELNRWWALGARLALSTRGWLERQPGLPRRRRKRHRHRAHFAHPARAPMPFSPDRPAHHSVYVRAQTDHAPECEMVLDPRALVTPSQWVERKLIERLGKAPVHVSRLEQHPKGHVRPRR